MYKWSILIKIKIINVNENKTDYNKNWPYTPEHPYRILIIGGSGSGKEMYC